MQATPDAEATFPMTQFDQSLAQQQVVLSIYVVVQPSNEAKCRAISYQDTVCQGIVYNYVHPSANPSVCHCCHRKAM